MEKKKKILLRFSFDFRKIYEDFGKLCQIETAAYSMLIFLLVTVQV